METKWWAHILVVSFVFAGLAQIGGGRAHAQSSTHQINLPVGEPIRTNPVGKPMGYSAGSTTTGAKNIPGTVNPNGVAHPVNLPIASDTSAYPTKIQVQGTFDADKIVAPGAGYTPDGKSEPQKVAVNLGFSKSTDQQIQRDSPKALREEYYNKLKLHYMMACTGRKGPVGQVFHEFVPESVTFNMGVAAVAAMHMKQNPAGLKHFYEQSIFDPMAHVSFAFFMLGSRLTQASLSSAGLVYDPCKNFSRKNVVVSEKIGKDGKPILDKDGKPDFKVEIKPTKTQKAFQHLVGPLGMAVGFMISTPLHELLTDPNIQACAKGYTQKLTAETKAARDQACDKAYESWATSRKIMGYADHIMAMTLTAAFQAYVVNLGVASIQKGTRHLFAGQLAALGMRSAIGSPRSPATWTFNTVLIMTGMVPGGQVVQLGMKVAHAFIFLTVQEAILPWIRFPWHRRLHGKDITGDINRLLSDLDRHERAGWVYTPKPIPSYCDDKYMTVYWDSGAPVMPPECLEQDVPPEKLVKKLGEKFKAWREFVLEKPNMAHSAWKDYLNEFQNMYANTYAFYKDLLTAINYKRTPGNEPDPLVEKLYQKAPFYGVNAQAPDQICNMSEEDKAFFKKAEGMIRGEIALWKATPRRNLPGVSAGDRMEKILDGIVAMDCSQPTKDAKDEAEDQALRTARYTAGMEALQDALQTAPWQDNGMDVNSPEYARLLHKNPFARIKKALGNVRPLPEGMAYLLDTNNASHIIDQTLKDLHPGGVGYNQRARTPLMTDYLLGMMVCGPQVEGGKTEIKVYKEQKRNWKDTLLYYTSQLTFGLVPADAIEIHDTDSMVVVRYETKEGESPVSSTLGIRASFRPPRIVEGVPNEICNSSPFKLNPMGFNIHTAKFKIGDKELTGFLDIVKEHANPSIVGNTAESFNFLKWWGANVDPHVIQVVEMYRKDYKSIVEKDFIPAFTREDEIEYNERKFEVGVAKSLLDEANLNLILFGKTLRLTPVRAKSEAGNKADEPKAALRERFTQLSNEFLKHLKLQTQLFADVATADKAVREIERLAAKPRPGSESADPVLSHTMRFRSAFNANKDVLMKLHKELSELNPKTAPATGNPDEKGMNMLVAVSAAALENLGGLVTETDHYFEIVDTVRVSGLE